MANETATKKTGGGRTGQDRRVRESVETDAKVDARHGRRETKKSATNMDKNKKNEQTARVNKKYNKSKQFKRDISSNHDEIRAQVEFYFGNSNLPFDNYLLGLAGGPANKPVELEQVCAFTRMKHFQPYSAVVSALEESEVLDIVKLPSGKEGVVRKTPIDSMYTSDAKQNEEIGEPRTMSRCVAIRGIPRQEEPSFQDDIEKMMAPYPVLSCRLRRTLKAGFKGSVFVEFESDEAAAQFLEMPDKPSFKDNKLQFLPKKQFLDEKAAEDAEREAILKKEKENADGAESGRKRRRSAEPDGGKEDGGEKADEPEEKRAKKADDSEAKGNGEAEGKGEKADGAKADGNGEKE